MGLLENTKRYLKQYFGYIIIFLACAIYIARGLVTIEETGKTIMQIIGDGFLVLLFGVFINHIFELQGIMNGEQNEKVLATNKTHADLVDSLSPEIDKLDEWCNKMNKEALKLARIRILSVFGLKYSDCFDEEGIAKKPSFFDKELKEQTKQERKLTKQKIRCFEKACKVKLTLLTANTLTSEGGREYDPFYFGQTKRQYKRKATIMDLLSKVGTAVIFGYYGVKLVTSFSWAYLIWTGLQVMLFLIMGTVKLYTSYMFIIDDYRSRTIKKIDNLIKFKDFTKKLKLNENKPIQDDSTKNNFVESECVENFI